MLPAAAAADSRAGLLASTYLEVQEVQQLKETYDESLVSYDSGATRSLLCVQRQQAEG
jgi:hypothetical protein